MKHRETIKERTQKTNSFQLIIKIPENNDQAKVWIYATHAI